MNKLKPEDVMRALECCERRDCERCNYKQRCGDACVLYLCGDALALLREKDAKIAEFQSIAEFQQSSNMKRWFELQEKDDQLAEKDAEIERFKHQISVYHKMIDISESKLEMLDFLIKKARAEAITEFADRIIRFYNALPGKTVGGSVEYHVKQVRDAMLKEAEK